MPVVSFYILQGSSTAEDILGVVILLALIVGAFFFAVILSLVFRSRAMRRALWFKSPFPESGCTGPMTGLSPVEAGIVISVDVSRLLTLYLLGLVTYEDIKLLDLTPLKIKVLAEGEMPEFRKKFLEAVKENGTLDSGKILLALDLLYNKIEKRVANYGVKDTVNHYLEKVDGIWQQMEKEQASAGKLETLQKQFSWLLLHEDGPRRLEKMFENTKQSSMAQSIAKMLRVVRNRIVADEELLRHAAHHPDGVFSNSKYREEVMSWARYYLSSRAVLPQWHAASLGKSFAHGREKRAQHLDKIQHLLEMVEDADES